MRRVGLAAKLAITIGLLSYIFAKLNISGALGHAAGADPWLLIAGVLMLALQPLIGTVRWQVVLRCIGAPAPLSAVLRATYVGVLFGQVLPTTVGADGLRMWFVRRAGCPLRGALNSVCLDRIVMLSSLIALVALDVSWLGHVIDVHSLALITFALFGAGVCGLAVLSQSDRFPARLQRYRLVRGLAELAQDTRALAFSPKYALSLTALSLVSYLNIIASFYLFVLAFGAAPEVLHFFMVLPPVFLIAAIPISIGGWGTREVAAVAALAAIGVRAHAALNASITLGIASILVALPGILFYLFDRAAIRSSFTAPAPASVLGTP